MIDIYIGYDPREETEWEVCRSTINRNTLRPHRVRGLRQEPLRQAGIYTRPFFMDADNQRIDERDGKPFSTEFSFTRFLIPVLQDYYGWAMFCDSDFIFPQGIKELLDLTDAPENQGYAVMVVKHAHDASNEPKYKMDRCLQTAYRRKNWSSLILWNCGHPSNRALTPHMVNHQPGSWLHGFNWLPDEEIGSLDPDWNYLVGIGGPVEETPRGIHHTLGTVPMMEAQGVEVPFADLWHAEAQKAGMERAA